MAKIGYNKLGLSKHRSEVSIVNWNEMDFEVRTYLPIQVMGELVQNIVNYSVDEFGYYNPIKINMFTMVETFLACVNVSITEKQKEHYEKIYDDIVDSGIYQIVPRDIYAQVSGYVSEVIRSVYEYKNSAYGIMDALASDYKEVGKEVKEIEETVSNPDSLKLVKDIVNKLG